MDNSNKGQASACIRRACRATVATICTNLRPQRISLIWFCRAQEVFYLVSRLVTDGDYLPHSPPLLCTTWRRRVEMAKSVNWKIGKRLQFRNYVIAKQSWFCFAVAISLKRPCDNIVYSTHEYLFCNKISFVYYAWHRKENVIFVRHSNTLKSDLVRIGASARSPCRNKDGFSSGWHLW